MQWVPVVLGLSPLGFLPREQRDTKGQEGRRVEPWVEYGSLWEKFGAREQPGRKQQGRWTPSTLSPACDSARTAVASADPRGCACSLLQGPVMERAPWPLSGPCTAQRAEKAGRSHLRPPLFCFHSPGAADFKGSGKPCLNWVSEVQVLPAAEHPKGNAALCWCPGNL